MQCAAERCINNDEGLCTVESMISICENCECALYQTSPERTIAVLQKKLDCLVREYERSVAENEQLANENAELRKQVPYPLVGTTIWVEDPMWGLISCKIDKPFHYSAGEDGGCTFEGFFTLEDIDRSVFTSEKAWLERQVKYSCPNDKKKSNTTETKPIIDKIS